LLLVTVRNNDSEEGTANLGSLLGLGTSDETPQKNSRLRPFLNTNERQREREVFLGNTRTEHSAWFAADGGRAENSCPLAPLCGLNQSLKRNLAQQPATETLSKVLATNLGAEWLPWNSCD